MSLSVQCRYASLLAFAEARAADCGRDDGGKFGPKNDCAADGSVASSSRPSKPKWMGKVDASGSTQHGDWFLEKNENGHKSPGHGDVTSHIVRLVDGSGNVKAFSHADLSDDGKDLYVNYSEVAEPFRGKGVYKSLLDSLSDNFRVTSDEKNNVASAAKKAYESLGAHENHYGQYVIDKKRRDRRAFCPTGSGGGVDNSCGSDSSPGKSDSSPSQDKASLPKSFPRGSEKIRDAIDSVSPDPKSVWDRARGRAETPLPQEMTQAADEQTSSGSALTPEAEKSYSALIDEIGRQYEALTEAGLKARAWKGEGEPYGDPPGSTKPNSDKMRAEVARTGDFSFFMTEKGFGTGAATPNHPMLRETKYKTADGEPMIANDLFRVVHDMVAHIRGGYSFSTNGEFNGMLTHASTLPESAWPALFAETFGQNAVYENTGNYAQQNAYASTVGPEIIRAELAKRNKKSSRAEDPSKDSDEPLGYQHIKSRPWLLESLAGVEKRAADCGANEEGGGGFQKGNTCATGEGGGDASARISSGEKPSKVLQSAGFKKMNFSGIERMLENATGKQRARILDDLDSLVSAIKVEPGLANVPIRVGPISQIYKNSPELLKEAKQMIKDAGGGVLKASADSVTMGINVFTDDDPDQEYEDGWNSSNSKEAVVVHEYAHIRHYQSMMKAFPHPGENELPGVSGIDYAMTMANSKADQMLKKDKSLRDKVKGVSKYATTDAFEFVAEYSTAVSLGDRDSDPDLDRLCKAVGAAVPRRTKK